MNYCVKDAKVAFKVRVELPGGITSETEENGMLQDSQWVYDCAGNDLALRYVGPMPLPEGIEPRWQMTRMP